MLKMLTLDHDLDAFKIELQGSIDASKSLEDDAESDERDINSTTATSPNTDPRQAPAVSSGFDQISSWRTCLPTSSNHKMPSTVLSLPPLPVGAFAPESHTDTGHGLGGHKRIDGTCLTHC